MANMVKIKQITVSKKGERGFAVTLPIVWVRDLDLKKGDRLDVYRDVDNRLIIVPAHSTIPFPRKAALS